ncbi:hypothetical protein E5P55_01120 [Candidatus Pinguicoccus supinus]|uniref:Trans-2-enoyl-CoA reductase catalytic domain-containing protein n=1 Tax=Candidatus Pinguicoccus supinus TaxID=2529394 RepID=A0A7T0BRX5_9BACT|nr:hypothetical protein E5P55_01120 [Candidatus Pinguicoccus supinus]
MNFTTYTHSYIGSEITWPIYKYGTLGLAKFNLYAYSKKILNFCKLFGGRVFLFINKALITQASAAIPAVPLYISLLYNKTRKSWTHENYINQNLRLFYRLNMFERIKFSVVRLDDFEIKTSTQFEIIFK